ncbi:MAG: CCA tRNA nucleotidyltransferase [Dehalococcoidia bacterium]|nr:CCA tRNA nucleotidyltransferase [Dehalococcoidia bacterium]
MSRNVINRLGESLSPESLALIQKAGALAAERRLSVYLVGGVVRDILLGRANSDLDLVVEGSAIKLAEALAGEVGGRLVVHRRFGTAKIRARNLIIDLAMARAETYARPGALPSVRPSSIHDDLARRDFTVNAMALRLDPGSFGKLVDPFDGQPDLGRKLIRILHDRSFIDDATRMLRAVRYEQRFGFRLEVSTEKLLRQNVSMMGTISGDRIRHELELILKEEHPEKALKRAGDLGLLGEVHPALGGNGWLKKVFDKARKVASPPSPALYFALLTYRFNGPDCEDFIVRLKMPGTVSRVIRDTARLREQTPLLDRPELPPSAISGLLEEYSPTSIQACAISSDSSLVQERLNLYLTRWRHVRTGLDGRALQKLGVPSGPRLGRMLKALQDAKLDGKIETRQDETDLVQRWLSQGR